MDDRADLPPPLRLPRRSQSSWDSSSIRRGSTSTTKKSATSSPTGTPSKGESQVIPSRMQRSSSRETKSSAAETRMPSWPTPTTKSSTLNTWDPHLATSPGSTTKVYSSWPPTPMAWSGSEPSVNSETSKDRSSQNPTPTPDTPVTS